MSILNEKNKQTNNNLKKITHELSNKKWWF